jgi:hypothetical protein
MKAGSRGVRERVGCCIRATTWRRRLEEALDSARGSGMGATQTAQRSAQPTTAPLTLKKPRSVSGKARLEKPGQGLIAGGEKLSRTRERPPCHSEIGNDAIDRA